MVRYAAALSVRGTPMIYERRRLIVLLLMVAAASIVFMTIRSAVQYVASAHISGEGQMGYNALRDENIPNDAKPKPGTEYLVSFDLYINGGKPSIWDRFVRWQKVEYNDPRFEQTNSWITEMGHGISLAEGIDISVYGPKEVQGAKLNEPRYGIRSTLVLLRITENAAEVELPDDFKAEMMIELAFFGRPVVVRNTD